MSAKHSSLIEIETPVLRPGSDGQTLFWMQEHAFCVHLNLRGDSSSSVFSEAVGAVTGTAPPEHPNTCVSSEHCRLAWLGPDEWLLGFLAMQRQQLQLGEKETGKLTSMRTKPRTIPGAAYAFPEAPEPSPTQNSQAINDTRYIYTRHKQYTMIQPSSYHIIYHTTVKCSGYKKWPNKYLSAEMRDQQSRVGVAGNKYEIIQN